MKRIALAMFLMASTSFAASEAPVSEYLNDPSYRSPLLTSRTAITDNFLDEFLARMSAMFNLQTSIAPFKAGTNVHGTKAHVASRAGILSASSKKDVKKDVVGAQVRKLTAERVSPGGREIELAAKKLPVSVGIGSNLETPWDAWQDRDEAVTEEYRDIEDR
jgi:hypothetical protein